jgi:hypothetical protein
VVQKPETLTTEELMRLISWETNLVQLSGESDPADRLLVEKLWRLLIGRINFGELRNDRQQR